jgi:hypothetical protein
MEKRGAFTPLGNQKPVAILTQISRLLVVRVLPKLQPILEVPPTNQSPDKQRNC